MVRALHRLTAKMHPATVLAAALALTACSVSPIPPARLPDVPRATTSDNALIGALREDWSKLRKVKMNEEERQKLIEHYNDKLLILLKRYRYDMAKFSANKGRADKAAISSSLAHIDISDSTRRAGVPLLDIYDDIVPSEIIVQKELEEHYKVPGLGVPLVGVIPAENLDRVREGAHTFRTRGTVRNLTAVLEFGNGGKPCLRLIPRSWQETIRIGPMTYQLAGNFSAAIELYWDMTEVDDKRILGLLRPQQLRDVTGLTCINGYNPDKIPVILTHGLLSSAGTFMNLINRLTNDPVIRQNYQFWFFNYPTGVAWTVSAAQYRAALAKVRKQVDPDHSNANWDKMVVVGHSMGGLITHYSQCKEPWNMLKGVPLLGSVQPYLQERYIDHALPKAPLNALRDNYFFRPVEAGMVVYMATPHQGAPMARYRIVSLFTGLVELPQTLIDEVINIATLQQDMIFFKQDQIAEWFTSVHQLSPDSYSIRGLKSLEVRDVPTFSVIGNNGDALLEKSSDGIVPYWSSHINWGGQKVVNWDHSVQDSPATAEYLRDILLQYLKENGRL